MLLPCDRRDALVEGVGIGCVDPPEYEHDARGETRPQADAIGVLKRARKRDLATQGTRLWDAQPPQFVCQQPLEALGATCKEGGVHRPTTCFRVCLTHRVTLRSCISPQE